MCIALAIAGAAVVSTAAGAIESSNAASAQKDAANKAQQTQQHMYDQTNANQAPFRQAGLDATTALGGFYGLPGYAKVDPSQQIQNLPGYQFQLNQGVQAIDRSAASRGLLNSGATGKALAQYGQGLAQNYSGQYVAGLQEIANRGEGATQSTAAAGAGAANQIQQAQLYSGNAAAQGDINTFNAISSGLNQGVGMYGYAQRGGFAGGGNGAQAPSFNSQPGLPGGYNPNASSSPWSYQALTGQT
jgi:hypothetical protein